MEYVKALEQLRPRGRTNLWAGLHQGLESLREDAPPPGAAARAKYVMLLTDGRPNINPPNGHVEELRNYRDAFPDHHVSISTFGFGYALDSDLLLSLATEGGGGYAFIPDALIVGTVFVNACASILATLTHDATLHLTPKGGTAFAPRQQTSDHTQRTSPGSYAAAAVAENHS